MTIEVNSEPAQGKTASARNLDPKSTVIISTDAGKDLSFPFARKNYNAANKNYFKLTDLDTIRTYLKNISDSAPHIKVVIVDTLTSCLEFYLQQERNKPGFNKYVGIGQQAWDFYVFCGTLREDLFVILMNHTETIKAVNAISGDEALRTQTLIPGAFVDKQKLTKFVNYSLTAFIDPEIDPSDKTIAHTRYKFRTQSNGADNARSTMDVLPYIMPNDLKLVIDMIRVNDWGEEPQTSELAIAN